jgi:hypothetical protein
VGLATRTFRRGVWVVAGCLGFSGGAVAQELLDEGGMRHHSRSHALHYLYGELQRLSQAGEHARALELAERAASVEMTPEIRAVIVRERVALGQWARVVVEAQRCMREAGPPASPRNHPSIVAACREALAQATPHTGTLRVTIEGEVPSDVSIFVAGQETHRALLGAPLGVEAGAVHVEVRASGHHPVDERVTVAARETITRALVLQPLPRLVIAAVGGAIPRELAPQPAPATPPSAP